jgi:hypothetical protein
MLNVVKLSAIMLSVVVQGKIASGAKHSCISNYKSLNHGLKCFITSGPEIVLVFWVAAVSAVRGIDWNGNWAFACDFIGGDFTSAQVTSL